MTNVLFTNVQMYIYVWRILIWLYLYDSDLPMRYDVYSCFEINGAVTT